MGRHAAAFVPSIPGGAQRCTLQAFVHISDKSVSSQRYSGFEAFDRNWNKWLIDDYINQY